MPTPRLLRLLVFPVLSAFAASTAEAQETPSENRPPYAFLRQAEDWSMFLAADPPADSFDPIKHVELSDDGSVWASFGGRVESRLESWRDFGFGPPPGVKDTDDEFILSRALLHGDLHVGEHFRLYLEGKSAQSTDRDLPGGRRALDMDTLALQQAFADIVLPLGESTFTLRPGRQMLLLGAQRLVSPLPWGNTLRTWEGLTAEWRGASWSITGLATVFVPVDKTEFNKPDDDLTLYGLYAQRAPGPDGRGLELYALANERPDVTVNGTTGDEERQTFGFRFWGPITERFEFEVESAYQTGEVGDGDVSAWFLATQAGWKPEGLAGKPRFWIGYDLASGDDDPTDEDVGTFHQLYPLGHAYFGYIDAIGRQNISDLSLGGKWSAGAATSVSASLHSFRLMETDDALYNAGGASYRSGFDSKDVGTEVDLTADHRFGRHLQAYAGYSHFFAGDAIAETGPDEDVDFLYVGARYTF